MTAQNKDSAHTKLLGLFKARREGGEFSFHRLLSQKTPPPIDWFDPRMRSHGAELAVTLTDADGGSLRKAFTTAGLDPENPLDWRKLMEMFAAAHFPPQAKRGAKRKWTAALWCELLQAFAAVSDQHPGWRDTMICKHLCRTQSDRYGANVQTLRRQLSYARDPRENTYLKRIQDEIGLAMEKHCLDEDIEVSEPTIWAAALEEALRFCAGRAVGSAK